MKKLLSVLMLVAGLSVMQAAVEVYTLDPAVNFDVGRPFIRTNVFITAKTVTRVQLFVAGTATTVQANFYDSNDTNELFQLTGFQTITNYQTNFTQVLTNLVGPEIVLFTNTFSGMVSLTQATVTEIALPVKGAFIAITTAPVDETLNPPWNIIRGLLVDFQTNATLIIHTR